MLPNVNYTDRPNTATLAILDGLSRCRECLIVARSFPLSLSIFVLGTIEALRDMPRAPVGLFPRGQAADTAVLVRSKVELTCSFIRINAATKITKIICFASSSRTAPDPLEK